MNGKWWWTIPPPFSVRTFMSVHLLSGVISNSACVLAFAAPPPLSDPAMDFLRQPLDVSLSEHSGSKHVCFAGDMFHRRPPFEEILNFKEWAEKLQEEITKLMGRKVCPVDWLSFYIDCEGVWMLATPKSEQSVNNMRQALNTILVALPKEQRRAVEDSLRPLDELDAERLAAWKNVDDLRPKVRPRQCKPDLLGTKNLTRDDLTDVSFTFVRPRPGDARPPIEPPKRAPTLAEFLKENDWTEEEDEEEEQEEGRGGDATPLRALTLHSSATLNCEAALALWTDPSQSTSSWTTENTWAARAQTQATIVIASAGVAPQLAYIRCHRETRRRQLLARKLGEEYATPGMVQAVEVAVGLAREDAHCALDLRPFDDTGKHEGGREDVRCALDRRPSDDTEKLEEGQDDEKEAMVCGVGVSRSKDQSPSATVEQARVSCEARAEDVLMNCDQEYRSQ